jgi:preprotein translocase subunit SecG
MFNSFLILTPLYQLMYVVIGIVVVIVIGVLLNESNGGNS